MALTNQDAHELLCAPFPADAIEWRVGAVSKDHIKPLAYITARAVMDRLDDVLGPGAWSTDLSEVGSLQGFACTLHVTWPDGTESHHTDVCDVSDIEPVKGAASGALKRSAVHIGVGRYLYNLDAEWVMLSDSRPPRGTPHGYHKGKFWTYPRLPDNALPPGKGGNAPEGSTSFDEVPIGPPPKGDKLDRAAVDGIMHEIAAAMRERGLTMTTDEGKKAVEYKLAEFWGVRQWDTLATIHQTPLAKGLEAFLASNPIDTAGSIA